MKAAELTAGDRFFWANHTWMSLGVREDGAVRAILLEPIEGVSLVQRRAHAWLQKYFVPALAPYINDIKPVRLPGGGRAYVSLPPIDAVVSAAQLFVPPWGMVMSCTSRGGGTVVYDGSTQQTVTAAGTLSFRVQPVVVLSPEAETGRK